jgi:hypothetical protein
MKRWAAWPQGIRWLVGIAAVVLVLAIVWALFVPLPDWLAHHDVGSVTGRPLQTARDAARGRLLTLAAGLLALGALIFTALNFNLLRQNSERADDWQRRTYEQAERGQVTDRYTKAVEQLGSDKLDVRIGGIYALGRLASDSDIDRPTVRDVLTAFIREHSREQWPLRGPVATSLDTTRSTVRDVFAAFIREYSHEQSPSGPAASPHTTRPDVQAAATVVGGLDMPPPRLIDLRGAELRGASLVGAHLDDANLDNANLDDANLNGAHLHGAYLRGTYLRRTWLYGADLSDANLIGAHLSGRNLGDVNLQHAHLELADLKSADLRRADLSGTHLSRADLSDALWPKEVPLPPGWKRNQLLDRLQRVRQDPAPEETDAPAERED